jgi:hypothetical protein
MYKLSEPAWEDDLKCVCSRDPEARALTDNEIKLYRSSVRGDRSRAGDSRRRVIPGVSITKID